MRLYGSQPAGLALPASDADLVILDALPDLASRCVHPPLSRRSPVSLACSKLVILDALPDLASKCVGPPYLAYHLSARRCHFVMCGWHPELPLAGGTAQTVARPSFSSGRHVWLAA